ncbi:hypothetical protein FOA52_012260 [Chlamydomonas sp. UWO 241]|nr:hypothetical protein FOA52_012260 [Chlamydomonas sp. UWO 241]
MTTQYYTDDTPGLKISPVVVIGMSISFIVFVTFLHILGKRVPGSILHRQTYTHQVAKPPAEPQRTVCCPSSPAPTHPGEVMTSQNQYKEAYTRVVERGSYADLALRKSPAKGEYFAPSPKQGISVLSRPVKQGSCRKNNEMFDVQHERDRDAFEKRANTYRKLATEKYHHNAPAGSIQTLWEEGHIVDKGRGHADQSGANVRDSVVFNDSPAQADIDRPQSAAPRPRTAAGTMMDTMGSYDPINHRYTQPRDAGYAAQKDREFSRATGGANAGVALVGDAVRATFNPILGQYRASHGAAHDAAASPAPFEFAGGLAVARPYASARCASASVGTAMPAEHAATPGRRTAVRQGESWGSYNPITHEWAAGAAPRDARYCDQNRMADRSAGVSGSTLGRPDTAMKQGVYNPITNHWVVPPANFRVAAGLSFAPASVFYATPLAKP